MRKAVINISGFDLTKKEFAKLKRTVIDISRTRKKNGKDISFLVQATNEEGNNMLHKSRN